MQRTAHAERDNRCARMSTADIAATPLVLSDPAEGGSSSPVTLRRRRQAHRLDERHQDLIHDLGEQLTGSL